MAYVKWKPEYDKVLRDRYGKERTEDIASELGVSYGTVHNHASELGLTRSVGSVVKLTADGIDSVVDMYKDGKSVKEIAHELGMTEMALRARFYREGIKLRKIRKGR